MRTSYRKIVKTKLKHYPGVSRETKRTIYVKVQDSIVGNVGLLAQEHKRSVNQMRKREHRKWGCVERNTRSIILSLVPRHCFLLNVFFLLVAYHLSLVAVSAQGGGPPGGHVQALAIDPSSPATLYAGTS